LSGEGGSIEDPYRLICQTGLADLDLGFGNSERASAPTRCGNRQNGDRRAADNVDELVRP
jgi:hypothetical protein